MAVTKDDLAEGVVLCLVPGVNVGLDQWLTEGREYVVKVVHYEDEVFYNIIDDVGDELTIDGYRLDAVELARVDPKELEDIWS